MKTKMKKNGFTLIELLVVISIIGLLASVVLVSLNSARSKARYTRSLADMKQISTAAELALDNYGTYAPDGNGGVLPPNLSGYLTRWPSPPCSGWVYDWENWDAGNNIMITMRKADSTVVYNYCVYTTTNCRGYTQIQTLSSKEITCNE